MDVEGRYRAPALDKGLDILELLAGAEEGLTQAEIAKALGRRPNEIFRMLDRLTRRGYLARRDDRYELTLKLFTLAHLQPPTRRLVTTATPVMRRLAREAAQACHLAIFDRGRVIVVAQFDAPGYWSLAIRVGAQVGLFNTGSGHVLLAFQAEAARQAMMAEHEDIGDDPPPDPVGLGERLRAVRERGFELMASRQTRGVMNVSMPVLGQGGHAVAALTCPFLGRNDGFGPELPQVVDLFTTAARELSAASGAPASRPHRTPAAGSSATHLQRHGPPP